MGARVYSMTGFARTDGALDARRWTFEMKSVNARGLEMRFRLPTGFEDLETAFRAILQKRLSRGAVFVSLQLKSEGGENRLRLNEAALQDALAALALVRERIDCAPPRADGVLALRGVIEPAGDDLDEAERESLVAGLRAGFDETVSALIDVRAAEGAAMADLLRAHVDAIEALAEAAGANAAAGPEAIRDRIAAQLTELLGADAVPAERLAQEAALLAVKADVREELDRLHAHIAAARALLARGGAIGREFDFLTQEFNREANTLCSKAQDIGLKQTGLELKKTIDQLREQVQNVE